MNLEGEVIHIITDSQSSYSEVEAVKTSVITEEIKCSTEQHSYHLAAC